MSNFLLKLHHVDVDVDDPVVEGKNSCSLLSYTVLANKTGSISRIAATISRI